MKAIGTIFTFTLTGFILYATYLNITLAPEVKKGLSSLSLPFWVAYLMALLKLIGISLILFNSQNQLKIFGYAFLILDLFIHLLTVRNKEDIAPILVITVLITLTYLTTKK